MCDFKSLVDRDEISSQLDFLDKPSQQTFKALQGLLISLIGRKMREKGTMKKPAQVEWFSREYNALLPPFVEAFQSAIPPSFTADALSKSKMASDKKRGKKPAAPKKLTGAQLLDKYTRVRRQHNRDAADGEEKAGFAFFFRKCLVKSASGGLAYRSGFGMSETLAATRILMARAAGKLDASFLVHDSATLDGEDDDDEEEEEDHKECDDSSAQNDESKVDNDERAGHVESKAPDQPGGSEVESFFLDRQQMDAVTASLRNWLPPDWFACCAVGAPAKFTKSPFGAAEFLFELGNGVRARDESDAGRDKKKGRMSAREAEAERRLSIASSSSGFFTPPSDSPSASPSLPSTVDVLDKALDKSLDKLKVLLPPPRPERSQEEQRLAVIKMKADLLSLASSEKCTQALTTMIEREIAAEYLNVNGENKSNENGQK